jgi:hypothetical protein
MEHDGFIETAEKSELEKKLESTEKEADLFDVVKELSKEPEVTEEQPITGEQKEEEKTEEKQEEVKSETETEQETTEEETETEFELPNEYKSYYDKLTDDSDKEGFKKLVEEFTNAKSYREKNVAANKAILDAFEAEPITVEILKDILKGYDIKQALTKYFNKEELAAAYDVGEEKTDIELELAKKERIKAKKEHDDFMASLEQNRTESAKQQKDFFDEVQMPKEKRVEFLGKIDQYLNDVYHGKISKEFYYMMMKAFDYEKSVDDARKQGEIKARNEKIELEKEKKQGDGLPSIQNKKTIPDAKPKRLTGAFAAIQQWEKSQIF